MKVVYTCRHADISDGQKAKLQRKFEKINRILTHGRDLEAHVVLSRERRGCEAEVTLRALHHTLVVSGQNAQAFAAAHIAVDKLVRQAAKKQAQVGGRAAAATASRRAEDPCTRGDGGSGQSRTRAGRCPKRARSEPQPGAEAPNAGRRANGARVQRRPPADLSRCGQRPDLRAVSGT